MIQFTGQISWALFPIGGILKLDADKIAAEQSLDISTWKDSRGICFVGKVDLPTILLQKQKFKWEILLKSLKVIIKTKSNLIICKILQMYINISVKME